MSTDCEEKNVLKRRRSSSSDMGDEKEELQSGECSRAWDDPSLLEEMGLGMLSEDSSGCDEVATDPECFPVTSSEDDCTENVQKNKDITHITKKRKVSEQCREPLKPQVLDTNVTVNDKEVIKLSPHRKKECDDSKMEAPKCVLKKSKVVSKSEKKNLNNKKNYSLTDDVCSSEFRLNPVPQVNQVCGKDYFSMLPDEIILGIFRFLDRLSVVRCRQVSKQFLRVANDESLWSRVDFGGKNVPAGALGKLMKRGCFIVRLAFACIQDPVVDLFTKPDDITSKIQYLDLSMATISPKGLATFLGYCKRLKKLSLENCCLNDQVCLAIARNRGLEVLNLSMCSGITPDGLQALLIHLKRLQSFNLAWTHLSQRALDLLARQIPYSVERLNISGCRYDLTDQNVIDILKRCDNLLELDISDCIQLTEGVIEYIVEEVSGLEYLAISRCYSIPMECLQSLKKVESLTYLDLFGLYSEGELKQLRSILDDKTLNQFLFSSVARPTVGVRRTSIWGLRVRD